MRDETNGKVTLTSVLYQGNTEKTPSIGDTFVIEQLVSVGAFTLGKPGATRPYLNTLQLPASTIDYNAEGTGLQYDLVVSNCILNESIGFAKSYIWNNCLFTSSCDFYENNSFIGGGIRRVSQAANHFASGSHSFSGGFYFEKSWAAINSAFRRGQAGSTIYFNDVSFFGLNTSAAIYFGPNTNVSVSGGSLVYGYNSGDTGISLGSSGTIQGCTESGLMYAINITAIDPAVATALGLSVSSGVYITSSSASYPVSIGGGTMTVQHPYINSNTPVVITFLAGDNTLAKIVSRINTSLASYITSSLPTVAASKDADKIVLTGPAPFRVNLKGANSDVTFVSLEPRRWDSILINNTSFSTESLPLKDAVAFCGIT
jgi:hypothetical protein